MKMFLMLLVILSLLIIPGCKTIEYIYPEYELPAEPQREILQQPETILDLGLIINYYDSLVSEWERWAIDVKKIITEEK